MKDIKCSILMIWMKDILLLERKFPVIFCLFQDIEDMSDI